MTTASESPGPSPSRGGDTWPDRRALGVLVGIWLAWAIGLLAFQELVAARLEPQRPDRVLGWTARHTTVDRFEGRPYLADPVLNTHVSFDSEYYLSIAVAGYDDDRVAQYEPAHGPPVSANYAFQALYPTAMRAIAAPLSWLGLSAIPAATVAGMAISLVAALAAAAALYRLARPWLGHEGGVRAAFYLLVFPSGFFLAQVYTEGLFLALAFGCLALAADRRPLLAGALAAAAVLTRPVGIALVLPLGLGLVMLVRDRWDRSRRPLDALRDALRETLRDAPRDLMAWGVAAVMPVVTYLAWLISPQGTNFGIVQRELGARATFNLDVAWAGWARAIGGWGEALPATRAYYALEVGVIVLAVVAGIWALRRWPGPALFGLAAVLIALTSGPAQGMIRYSLAAPAIFLFLAHLGRHPAFDRGWTIFSLLLMGLLAALFSMDFWVA